MKRRAMSAHLGGVLAALLAVLAAASCGAPQSEAFGGSVGEAVEAAIASGTETFDHSAWDALLGAAVRDGFADYPLFRERRRELDAYLDSIASARLDTLAADELKALLINAYNAYTVRSILDHEGISSIREIDGVWDQRTHVVGGYDLTLDNMEHNLLRPYYNDPRIHFAVNCASQSCAPLPTWAFTGDGLDAQLEDVTREFFAARKFLVVESDGIRTTQLLDWYGSDFTDPEAQPRADSLVDFVAHYATPEDRAAITAIGPGAKVRFLDYDWALNQAR